MVHVMNLICGLLVSVLSVGVTNQENADLAKKKFTYKEIDGRKLSIYVTTPKSENAKVDGKRPAIAFFHGGGWVGGKPGQFDEHAKYFATRGVVCFQVQYRLLSGKKPAQSPEICINDAKSAMRWIRKNGEKFNVDPNRIASAGGSAGGHLAAAIGTIDGCDDPTDDKKISAKSNAMILFNPVFDNGPGGWGTKRVGDRYAEFSPFHNISRDDPPAIIFLGSNDKLIPVKTVEKFAAKMKDSGVKCEFKIYQGKGHGFFNFGRDGNKAYMDTVTLSDKFLASLGWIEGPPMLQTEK